MHVKPNALGVLFIHKPVAHAHLGEDKAGIGRIVLNFPPDIGHEYTQGLVIVRGGLSGISLFLRGSSGPDSVGFGTAGHRRHGGAAADPAKVRCAHHRGFR